MFRKSDILPLVLALASTTLIVTIGFSWLLKSNIAGFGKNPIPKISDAHANLVPGESQRIDPAQANFVVPAIVPQGTSVAINGSGKLSQINKALRRSFHQQYPGTMITTDTDGNDVALKQLYAGDIDLLALDRPLNKKEQAAGLASIQIKLSEVNQEQSNSPMYYVYREPLSPDLEAFLGYALSTKGQDAIANH